MHERLLLRRAAPDAFKAVMEEEPVIGDMQYLFWVLIPTGDTRSWVALVILEMVWLALLAEPWVPALWGGRWLTLLVAASGHRSSHGSAVNAAYSQIRAGLATARATCRRIMKVLTAA